MKEKLLIYSSSHGIWGGGQIYIEQLCNYLNENNKESYIITSEPFSFACPVKEMENVLSKSKRLTSAIKIAKEYKQEGFQTIILNDLSSLWLAPIFKFYGFKVVSLLHLYLQKRSENPLGHALLEYHLLKFSAKFCNTIFSVNKNNQEVFGKNRVQFIGNYVPDWFFESPKNKNAKKYDFILIARLSKQKNIPLFLEILDKLNHGSSAKKYTVLIVGEGPEQKEIESTIIKKELTEYVKLQGWVERKELPSVYDLGKCFVISSHHEGFATTLLEAHSRGIPAIVTHSSGFCGEYVDGYNAKTGIVFDEDDLKSNVFYGDIEKLIKEVDTYKSPCIEKAKIFSEYNVLNPILRAVSFSESTS
jgi:glycosyltransferase involved in cell wall biosynthesis